MPDPVPGHEFSFGVLGWSCWAPGLESPAQWVEWLAGDVSPPREGAPELKELKPILRRRLSPLGRAAYHCATLAARNECPAATVFASAHGEYHRTVTLLESIARNEPMSPNHFSLSVHNAIAGLLSMFLDWRAPAYSIPTGDEGIGAAFIVAANALRRAPAQSHVLVVLCDEVVPSPFDGRIAGPPALTAAALLLGRSKERAESTLSANRQSWHSPGIEPWDQVRQLIALLASSSGTMAFDAGRARWSWRFA